MDVYKVSRGCPVTGVFPISLLYKTLLRSQLILFNGFTEDPLEIFKFFNVLVKSGYPILVTFTILVLPLVLIPQALVQVPRLKILIDSSLYTLNAILRSSVLTSS